MAESSGEKQYAATERKLQEAREQGQVPMGRDLLAAAAFGGLALALLLLPDRLLHLARTGQVLIEQAPDLAASGMTARIGALFWQALAALAPLLLLPAGGVIAMLFAQQALVVASDRITPKLSRISPLEGAKKRFGLSGLMEFAKSAVKLLLITGLLVTYLDHRAVEILATSALDARHGMLTLAQLIVEFVLLLTLAQLVIGALDLLWQRFDHQRQLRMTRKELTDDLKQTEGDPHLKAQRRRRAEEVATSRMLSDVAEANVVIVNPTHYAVALKWSRTSSGAPICVAKGVDEVAARIRAKAAEAGVPIRRDPPVARALYATMELGAQILPEHYRPVAAAIRYAEDLRRRAARRGGGRKTDAK